MSDLEQQLDEVEVLRSIFPEEFATITDYSELPTEWQAIAFQNPFQITLKPNDLGNDKEAHVSIDLIGAMPSQYPTTGALLVHIRPLKGLGSEQIDELQEICMACALENIGMPSAYNVAIAAQEWLSENNTPGSDGSMYAEMLRREQKKVVVEKKQAYKAAVKLAADSEVRSSQVDKAELERQQRRQAGHAVTRETFLAWKEKFEAEKIQLASFKSTSFGVDESKLSGKQWFLAQQASGKSITEDEEEAKLLEDGEKDDFVLELGEDYDEEDDEDYVEGEEDEGDNDEAYQDEIDDTDESNEDGEDSDRKEQVKIQEKLPVKAAQPAKKAGIK